MKDQETVTVDIRTKIVGNTNQYDSEGMNGVTATEPHPTGTFYTFASFDESANSGELRFKDF